MNGQALVQPAVLAGLCGGCAAGRVGTKDLAFAGMLTILFYVIGRFVKLIDKL